MYARDRAFYNVVEHLSNQTATGCAMPCKKTTYEVRIKEEPPSLLVAANGAQVYLQASMQVEHREEVLLYDFNNIVSALGGSLGLFLGFSCLSLFTYTGRMAKKMYFKDRVELVDLK